MGLSWRKGCGAGERGVGLEKGVWRLRKGCGAELEKGVWGWRKGCGADLEKGVWG